MLEDIYPKFTPGPPKPSGVFAPSVFSMPPGIERYEVAGCGAVLFAVEPGDQIIVINQQGGQPCEVIAVDNRGRFDAGVLQQSNNSGALGFKQLLSNGDLSLRSVRLGLEARCVNLAEARSLRFFDSQTPAKCEEVLDVARTGTLVVAAPGGIMNFDAQDTATPLTVQVKRAVIKEHVKFELPDPLANPLADIRIHSATARSYFVKAGDFIQIYDVDGRQCTDFQCFFSAKIGQRYRACARRDNHAHIDGTCLSNAGAPCEIL